MSSKKEFKYIGKGVPRIDADEKVTGQARYVSDISMPGMLHAKMLTSSVAHAKIKKIDTSKAKALDGVVAVLTGEELDYNVGLYLVDKRILARDKVRYQGEPVAAVAAETLEIAEKAIKLIEVEYELFKPLLDVEESFNEKENLIHPDLGNYSHLKAAFFPQPGTNICHVSKIRKGDIEKGFAEADVVVEREYNNPSVQHVPMETHGAIVQWGVSDKVMIYTSAQSPFTVRNLFCYTFKLPHQKVRVVVPYVGGGFGGKAGIHFEPLVGCLSRAAGGRPVKLIATREEEYNTLPCRCGLKFKIKTGLKKDGKITAQKLVLLWSAGAYADYAVNVTRASGYSAGGPYYYENLYTDSYTVYTNQVFGTAYRGFGHVELFWGLERHMDFCAGKLGIDPYEFKKINLLRPDNTTATGEIVTDSSGSVRKCLDAVVKEIGWNGIKTKQERDQEIKTGKVRGKGFAVLHKAPAMPSNTSSSCIIKMNENGSVILNVSATDYGNGTYTPLTQIIAEEMDIPLSKIHVAFETDTDRDPYDWQTVASRFMPMGGRAVINACNELKKKMSEVAAKVFECSQDDFIFGDEKIILKNNTDKFIQYEKLATGYVFPNGNAIGGPLIGVGVYIAEGLTNLDKETGQGLPAFNWTFGAHGVEVEVDVETGEFTVLKIASALDVGKVMNEASLKGQLIGGVVQGLGTAICERYVYSNDGRLLNKSFTDNKIPTAKDIPNVFVPIFIETPHDKGAYGSRGAAEHPMISVAPAIGNALNDALGIELTEMPIRSEDVWLALNKEKALVG
ncbi:MAG: xanthine dehydrogenase family protein molybdopterin-binding subunit [Bacteroidota bacterium]|nr:xanthine dehydrogenase family protein molybdopterin-binding subunit [Bacteroidota bacterium]